MFIFWFPGKQEVLREKDEYIEGSWLLKLIGIYNALFVLTLHFWLFSIFNNVPAKITKKLLRLVLWWSFLDIFLIILLEYFCDTCMGKVTN